MQKFFLHQLQFIATVAATMEAGETEEVQCPLCQQYHNVEKREIDDDNHKPSIGEVLGGTVKVIGVASIIATILARNDIKSGHGTPADALQSWIHLEKDTWLTPKMGKAVTGVIFMTGMLCTVWTLLQKKKEKQRKEEDFRTSLEVCGECWKGIRKALLD